MDETRIDLCRHGETAWNVEGRLQGWLDSPLTARGRAQAAALAERLRPLRPARLVASDLGRAMETARIVAGALGVDLRPDARFREKGGGIFEGLTWPEAERDHPAEVALYRSGNPRYALPGGEDWESFQNRAAAGLAELAAEAAGTRVALVTHGGVIQALVRHVLGIPLPSPRRFVLRNGSLFHLEVRDGAFWLTGFSGDPPAPGGGPDAQD
ncbi:MAG: histidine phosphatase family protein [Planctomycetes bacterium]|jgi:probable phosphoglycerate mutase|nr:histidine phosphatase family protein [Planctomycetota bacterium]